MSRITDDIENKRRQIGEEAYKTLGMIRRMVVKLTSRSFWQVVGVLLLDRSTKETLECENFSGIGFYARPAPGSNTDAIVVFPGGEAEGGVIVATRDEDARKRAANIDENETIMFNREVVVVCRKTGTVEIRGVNDAPGSGLSIPTMQDFENLRSVVNASNTSHLHQVVVPGVGTVTSGAPLSPITAPTPVGTVILKTR